MQTHALLLNQDCIIILSSHSIHLIDTNQSECKGVKNWFEDCTFYCDNGSN